MMYIILLKKYYSQIWINSESRKTTGSFLRLVEINLTNEEAGNGWEHWGTPWAGAGKTLLKEVFVLSVARWLAFFYLVW